MILRPRRKAFVDEVGGAGRVAHFERHFERRLIGAAVQRAVQCAERRGQYVFDRRQRARDDARRERARVEAVFDLQDLRHVERVCEFGLVGRQRREAHLRQEARVRIEQLARRRQRPRRARS